MIHKIINSPLFSGMTEDAIQDCLQCSKSEMISYKKDEIIFHQNDEPEKLHVLVDGSVAVCNDTVSGKRSIVATFDQSGELFGEVFVFLDQREYDHYAQAVTPARVLQIPKDFLYHTYIDEYGYHSQMISNMLSILAQKAYFLNQKVQILSCTSLRQKISKIMLKNCQPDGKVTLSMNREELADYLNTARPSLSRELMNMQEDGLIQIQKKEITIIDFDELQNII